MKFIKKHLMISCREATLIMAKREENKLSFTERLNLFIHTSMCSLCSKFQKQTSKIGKESRHIHAEQILPDEVKDRLQKLINRN